MSVRLSVARLVFVVVLMQAFGAVVCEASCDDVSRPAASADAQSAAAGGAEHCRGGGMVPAVRAAHPPCQHDVTAALVATDARVRFLEAIASVPTATSFGVQPMTVDRGAPTAVRRSPPLARPLVPLRV